MIDLKALKLKSLEFVLSSLFDQVDDLFKLFVDGLDFINHSLPTTLANLKRTLIEGLYSSAEGTARPPVLRHNFMGRLETLPVHEVVAV